jgi:hypothetical protein
MSIVSIDFEKYPALAEAMKGVEKREQAESLGFVEVKRAQEQGRDLVEHFVEFAEGTRDNFGAYFMFADNPHHLFQREGFLDEIKANYPDMTTVPCEGKPDQREHIFQGMGVYLREEMHYSDTNEPCAVWYTAHHLETPFEVGKIAASQIMQ